MKKYLFLMLCSVGLYAQTQFFLGLGGAYGIGSGVSAKGNNFTINNQTWATYQIDSVGFEGVVGYERFFSRNIGVRYYTNLGYGFMNGKQSALGVADLGANFDLMAQIPFSESFTLRFFGGVNTALNFLTGDLPQGFKKLFDQVESGALTNYEVGYSSLASTISANLGVNVLLGQHHALEIGSKIPVVGRDVTLFHFRQTTAGQGKNKFIYTMPVNFTLRYIYLF